MISRLLVVATIAGIAAAQTPHPPTATKNQYGQFTLTSIEVTGNRHYSADQIKSVTGLRLGQSVTADNKTVNEDIFRQAASAVSSTGAFSDVTYRYEFSSRGTKFVLQVQESDKFLPIRFDNFVWFSDTELIDALKVRVPLFDGSLPSSGTIVDQVAQALNAILAERKVQGTVEDIPTGKMNGPIEAIMYTVSGPSIRIHGVEFPGAHPEEVPLLESAAGPLVGQEYSRSMLQAQGKFNFLPIYLSRGYLRAEFADSSAKIFQQTDANKTLVDAICAVSPNLQYKLAEIQWTGNAVFPSDKLQPLVHLRVGEPANAIQLSTDLDAVKELYGSRGYVMAQAIALPQFDDASSHVHYVLQIQEGDQYRMGDFQVKGLDADSSRAIASLWKMARGDVYDASYMKVQFLPSLSKVRIRLNPNEKIEVQNKLNDSSKTVDVTVNFASPK